LILRNVSRAPSQHIRLISEGSRDQNYVLNCNDISQCYWFYCNL